MTAHVQTNGIIYGIVSEEGVAKPSTKVVLSDHARLTPLAVTFTDINGGYLFNNLDTTKTDYMVYTADPDGSPVKNALIKDMVTPTVSANGHLKGNFAAALDRTNPFYSRIVIKRQNVSNAADQYYLLGAGGNTTAGTYAATIVPRTTVTNGGDGPIPTNADIGVLAITNSKVSSPADANHIMTNGYAQLQANTGTPSFTMMATIFSQATVPSSVALNRTWLYDQATWESWYYGSGSGDFSTNTSTLTFRPCEGGMRVVIQGGNLQLFWVQKPASGAPTTGRSHTITAVDDQKWYMIFVKCDAADWASANGMKITVFNVTDNISTDYTIASAPVSWTDLTYATFYNSGLQGCLYGMSYAGTVASGTFGTTASNTAGSYNVNCFQNTVGTAYFGPSAYWVRALTQTEIAFITDAAYNTATATRHYPLWLSELHALHPEWYVSLDADPINRDQCHNLLGVTKRGLSLHTTANAATAPALANRGYTQGYTGRRRALFKPQGVFALRSMYLYGAYSWPFTVVCGIYKSGALPSTSYLYYMWGHNINSASYLDNMGAWGSQFTTTARPVEALYLSSSGNLTMVVLNTSSTTFTHVWTINPAVWTDGQHIIAIRYTNGQPLSLFIDGVFHSNANVNGTTGGTAGIAGTFGRHEWGISLDGSVSYASGWRAASPNNVAVNLTDIAVFKGTLHTADITELSDAYLLATGPDSRA